VCIITDIRKNLKSCPKVEQLAQRAGCAASLPGGIQEPAG